MLLEHRRQMRNLVAVIRACVNRTAAGAASVDEYVDHLSGRLGAIARVQEILMRELCPMADLTELLDEEFLSQGVARERVDIDCSPLLLDCDVAAPLALALHELTTNAIKFGAFATPQGRLSVRWHAVPGEPGWTALEWREVSLGVVDPPGNAGYGFELIRKTLPYELGAKTRIDLTWRGLHCDIAFRARAAEPEDG